MYMRCCEINSVTEISDERFLTIINSQTCNWGEWLQSILPEFRLFKEEKVTRKILVEIVYEYVKIF